MTQIIERIANEIVNELKEKLFIPVEASGRHIHLSRADADSLFGEGYQFTKVKDLSQPGQYACKERVTVTGPKGSIHNVIVLGPERKQSQMEVSLTDALALGIKAPVRQSGDTKGSPGITVTNGSRSVTLAEGIIVAKRHIHMTPEDAQKFNVKDGEIVKVSGSRPVIFEDTVVRVSKDFRTYMHIDYDEANACGYNKDSWGIIVK